jgi:hypothetical protein
MSAKFQLPTLFRSGLAFEKKNIQTKIISPISKPRAKCSVFRIFSIGSGDPSISLPNFSYPFRLELG